MHTGESGTTRREVRWRGESLGEETNGVRDAGPGREVSIHHGVSSLLRVFDGVSRAEIGNQKPST